MKLDFGFTFVIVADVDCWGAIAVTAVVLLGTNCVAADVVDRCNCCCY